MGGYGWMILIDCVYGMGVRSRSGLLLLGLAGVPVGRSLLLSGDKGNEVLLVEDALVGASSGLAGLVDFGDLGSLLSDLAGLREGSVLLAHQ